MLQVDTFTARQYSHLYHVRLAYATPNLAVYWGILLISQSKPWKPCCHACRVKALVRIQNKEASSHAATSSSAAEYLTAHDYSWMVKAMDQLGIARQVSGAWGPWCCCVGLWVSFSGCVSWWGACRMVYTDCTHVPAIATCTPAYSQECAQGCGCATSNSAAMEFQVHNCCSQPARPERILASLRCTA
jgi:hypothetical protein